MTFREADGSDKIAAFERGMDDEAVALAFETSGVTAYIVAETYLVAFSITGIVLTEQVYRRFYANDGTRDDVIKFLNQQAATFGCSFIRFAC